MADLLEQRLIEAGRHWQAAQPSPPPVPVNRLAAVGTRRSRTAWVEAAAAVAAAVAVAGGITFAVTRPESPTEPLGPPPPAPSTHQVGPVVPGAVPFVPLPARHPDRRTMAAFGSVSVYGAISGRVRPGDTLSFTVLNTTLANFVNNDAGYIFSADIIGGKITGAVGNGATPGVPEPATWAMMILGMGMVGAGMRMRRRPVLATA